MSQQFYKGESIASRALFACLLSSILSCQSVAYALGVVGGVPVHGIHRHPVVNHVSHKLAKTRANVTSRTGKQARYSNAKPAREKGGKKKSRAHKELPVPLPQDLSDKLNIKTIAPGVVYKSYHGPLSINLIDVSLSKAPVQVRPVLAGETFCLADVKNHARQCQAIAAVNANYFKKDGTPLGTLIIDKEWVAGPLYDRVSLGITNCGFVRIDRVNLFGTLETSNPGAPSIWVNNINQPRRHGSRLILYNRHWGNRVVMPYAGCLVAVNADGQVVDKKTTIINIPPGGYVLSDTKSGQIAKLHPGDLAQLSWHTRPDEWSDVEQAVSGGPMLIKDGELYLDLKAENFRKAWTGRQIHARTAAGVTADNHLLLVTIEGSHTLWDFAKFLRKMGAVDAMNLDGGGSTTMVVDGMTVTRNANSFQRRVASSLAVIDMRTCRLPARSSKAANYVPSSDLKEFVTPEVLSPPEDALTGLDLPPLPALDQAEQMEQTEQPAAADVVSQVGAPAHTP
jgi:hypothetical protein